MFLIILKDKEYLDTVQVLFDLFSFIFNIITKNDIKRLYYMVIDPSNSIHTLSVVPRFYPTNSLVVALYNETTNVTATPSATYVITNGKLNITFTFTFVENDRHQLKVTEGTEVVYRGKTLTTSQEPQEFKLTNGLYTYS